MKLFARSLFVLLFLFSFVFFTKSVFAQETGYRFPTTCITNGSSCENMREQDDKYNSWVNARSQEVVATFEDFGIPDNAILIHNIRVKLRMRTSANGMPWAPRISIDGGATFLNDIYVGCEGCYYATTSFNSIDNYNLRWYGDPLRLPYVPAADINSGKFRLKIMQKYAIVSTTDIDTLLFNIEYSVPITPTPTPKTPLILIPGIGGSELKSSQTFTSTIKECGTLPPFTYNTNDIVWINAVVAGVSPCDDYFDVLKLKADGQTPEYPQIVLNGTFFGGAYGGFIKFFTDNGYEIDKTLFLFPYDWRKDIALTKTDLDTKIYRIKLQTGSQKVDIVAHSMGGLVARHYIADASKASKVRKLFTLGTPHLGSIDSLKNLEFGGCLTKPDFENLPFCLGITNSEVKDILKNMISGFELIPSQVYFNFYDGQDNNHPSPYQVDGQSFNYDQIKSFLAGLSYNTSLFTPSELFHALDNSLTNTNGVDVTNIAGSGLPTLGKIIEKSVKNFLGNTVQKKDGFTINGDKTVPLFSASLYDPNKNLSLLGNAKVFYTQQEHGNLVSSGPALNLVKNILNNDSQLPAGVSAQPYHFSGTGVSVHSPVNIHVYDSAGRHTGPASNGDFETDIPGSSYDTLDDAKFIFLPDDGQYSIKFEATDQGSFDFKIRKFENDINTTAVLYNDVPLAASTKVQATLDTLSTQPPTLQVDQDGNGTIDKQVDPTAILTGDAIYDETPPEAKIFVDQDKQNLIVTGVDENPTTVTKLDNTLTKKKDDAFYVITDAAGNSTKIDVREVDKTKQDRFRIYSVQYNANAPIVLDNNHFNVSYNGKKERTNVKEQNYELKGEVKIRIQYDSKKNKSTIVIKEPKQERVREVRNGLVYLNLLTDKGQLKTSY